MRVLGVWVRLVGIRDSTNGRIAKLANTEVSRGKTLMCKEETLLFLVPIDSQTQGVMDAAAVL